MPWFFHQFSFYSDALFSQPWGLEGVHESVRIPCLRIKPKDPERSKSQVPSPKPQVQQLFDLYLPDSLSLSGEWGKRIAMIAPYKVFYSSPLPSFPSKYQGDILFRAGVQDLSYKASRFRELNPPGSMDCNAFEGGFVDLSLPFGG